MQKIVVNRRGGGVCLSHNAIMRYAQIKGIEIFAYQHPRTPDGGLDRNVNVMVKPGDAVAGIVNYFTKPIDPNVELFVNDGVFYAYDIPRTDPALVQVVQEMGAAAEEVGSVLEVVEVPDGVEWYIHDDDCMESVHEKHRVW